jgi:CDP-paratose 2-epimerase
MSYKKILVTGGAGFVGSTLAIRLKAAFPDADVAALDNLKRRGSELNLPRLKAAGVGFVHGDIRSMGDLLAVRPEPELIVECSAEPSAQAGYGGSPEYLIGSNLIGCYHCLELARRVKADFVFLSTSRVYPYGPLNELAFVETEKRYKLAERQTVPGASAFGVSEGFPLDGARSLYGMTKLAAELMVEEYADAYGLRAIIDRAGLLTGPWQMAKSDQGVIAFWMAAHYFKKPVAYIGFGGTGKQVRDFLHIDDFCDLILAQLGDFDRYRGRRFNVGGGEANSLSLVEATELCAEVTGNKVQVGSVSETRPADVRIYLTDHRALTSVSGWKPKRDAKATLGDIHDWMRREEKALKPLLG